MLFPYLPFYYFIKTRLNGVSQQISFATIYLVPVFGFIFLKIITGNAVNYFFCTVLSIVILNIVYENGYIQNDVWTVRNEKKPTKRLSDLENTYIAKNRYLIAVVRAIVFLLFSYLLYSIANFEYFIIVIVSAFLLQILFIIYNKIRSILNIIMIVPMAYLRFYGPLLPWLIIDKDFGFAVGLLFLYPIPKALEFCRQKKYNLVRISKFIGNIDVFRVKYYGSFAVLILILRFYQVIDWYFVQLTFFFLIYRILGLSLVSYFGAFRQYVRDGAKSDYRD